MPKGKHHTSWNVWVENILLVGSFLLAVGTALIEFVTTFREKKKEHQDDNKTEAEN